MSTMQEREMASAAMRGAAEDSEARIIEAIAAAEARILAAMGAAALPPDTAQGGEGTGVRVKPLEWGHMGNRNCALSSWGEYWTAEHPGADGLWGAWFEHRRAIGRYQTFEEAKAACEADYEARILSTLQVQTEGWKLVPVEPTIEMIQAAAALKSPIVKYRDLYLSLIHI